jgi:signal transduction histidine kinase
MYRRLSLLWKIWLSTSVALTAFFGVVGLVLERQVAETTSESLQEEVRAGFQAYESVWKAREEILGSTAAVLSSLPNVRAAFGTRDQATIRDTAAEVWERVAERLKETCFFVVTSPQGNTIASLDDRTAAFLPPSWPVVEAVGRRFPAQVSGFFFHDSQLFQLVITPVYVDSARGRDLISVLVAGYPVDNAAAARLKLLAGGSEFTFYNGRRRFASTLPAGEGEEGFARLERDLVSVEGRTVGRLAILRSLGAVNQRLAGLRRNLVLIWLGAMIAGLALTWLLARQIVRPVEALDHAAAEIARQNFDHRVSIGPRWRADELGRLAATFNMMCESLQKARRELIRQERISTIGRMASSIVHDLRNPLAAIYGGAEMMVDTDLAQPQMKRLAANIYQASRRIQQMLQDLLDLSGAKAGTMEPCRLREIVESAVDGHASEAERLGISVAVDLSGDLEVPAQRARLERVFSNLIGNALEVLPRGGVIHIEGRKTGRDVEVDVRDNGPGISDEIRDQLFQPFVTAGKKNGLGLGLALSRQTVLDHGGDIAAGAAPGGGARFTVRLPRAG